MTPPTDSAAGHSPRALTWILAAGLLIAVATALWSQLVVGARVRELAAQVEDLRQATQRAHDTLRLIRIEGPSEGRGVEAIVEQVGYWAPILESAAAPDPYVPFVRTRLDECLDALRGLGADSYDRIYGALEAATNDEVRKWLLRGLMRLDAERATDLLARVVRSTRLSPSARLRFAAADELLATDRALAGAVLKNVLEIESASGITRQVPPELRPEYESYLGTNQFPQFFNFVEKFVQSGHPDTAEVLTMLIGREEHDLLTYQQCIRHLGTLRAKAATRRIEQLFQKPPGRFLNPLFQNTCLQALADIEGQGACAFFQKALTETRNETVVAKLQALVKEFCQ